MGEAEEHESQPEAEAASRVLNPMPRPRVAVAGLSDGQIDAIRPLCGTVYEGPIPNLAEVDILVTAVGIREPTRCHVLLWGDSTWHDIREPRQNEWKKAAEVTLDPWAADLPEKYPPFLKSARNYAELVSAARRRGNAVKDEIRDALDGRVQVMGREPQFGHEIVSAPVDAYSRGIDQLFKAAASNPLDARGVVSLGVGEAPLVWTSDASIAAFYSPIGHRSDKVALSEVDGWTHVGLSLPTEADLRLWLWCFMNHLHTIDVEAVPKLPPTVTSPRDWFTPAQIALEADREEVFRQAQGLLSEWTDLGDAIDQLGDEADSGIRGVLWSGGDELVHAVAALLEDLGFGVIEVDQTLDPGERKREDLHVFPDQDGEGAPVLVEVKGYPNDAKTGDLRQIREQREGFMRKADRDPVGSWWIFNDHRSTPDPSQRGPSVPNGEELLKTIGVVAIPTRDLYLLWRDAGADRIPAEDARSLLMSAQPGIFTYRSDQN